MITVRPTATSPIGPINLARPVSRCTLQELSILPLQAISPFGIPTVPKNGPTASIPTPEPQRALLTTSWLKPQKLSITAARKKRARCRRRNPSCASAGPSAPSRRFPARPPSRGVLPNAAQLPTARIGPVAHTFAARGDVGIDRAGAVVSCGQQHREC